MRATTPCLARSLFLLVLGLLACAAPGARAAEKSPIVFEDVTERVGLSGPLAGWQLAHGAAWGDISNNGYPDLYIGAFADRPVYGEPNAPIPNMLLLNEKTRFTLSPDKGIRFDKERARTSMALFVDLDNNGRLDLMAGTHGSPADTRLYENRWPGEFRNVTPTWPRQLEMRNATSIDLDQDGLLDLLFFDGAYSGNDQSVMALRNLGGFRFEEVTAQYGLPTSASRTLGSAIGDVNDDGRLDIFLADCNRLFVSGKDGRYRECKPGFFRQHKFSDWPCGAAFADLTGDGLLDLVFTVHGVPAQVFLYVNRGIDDEGMPVFEHATAAAGLELDFRQVPKEVLVKGTQLALVDLDRDGRRDILLGMIHKDARGHVQPYALRNTGVVDGIPRFSAPPTSSLLGYYATAPVADYDRDGRVDIFMATWFDTLKSYLFRNVTPGGRSLTVRVTGAAPNLNRMGVGATVRVYAAGKAGDVRHLLGRADISIGNGYSCGDEGVAHFGLGDRKRCDVEVSWQGYHVRRTRVATNRILEVPVGL